jgi:hypothetical protein
VDRNLSKYKPEQLVIAFATVLNLFIHLVAGFNSGFHGDELLHIEAGRHLAAGYMDFAPVIAWLAAIQNLFQSDSIFINHLFVYLASSLIFVLSGMTTIRVGGKWPAVLTVMVCLFFSPGVGASHTLFLPALFEQLAWVAGVYLLVNFCNHQKNSFLVWFAIVAALGFLTKYSTAFFIAGVAFSVLLLQRELLKNKFLWIALAIFIVIILSNIIWQMKNGFPVFSHFSELYETQLDKQSRFDELKTLVLFLNPATAVFWIAGLLAVPFVSGLKKYRLAAFSLLTAFVLLLAAKGKSYYFFPIVLGILPFGSVYFEQLFSARKSILIGWLSLTSIIGAVSLPYGIPLLPLEKFISFYQLQPNEDNRVAVPFENYYSKGIWELVLVSVSKTYQMLPDNEKEKCLVWGRHYSQAGGINLLGKRYDLPQAFSFHSSFYNWVPDFEKDAVIIVIADPAWDSEHWQRFFNSVEEVSTIENRYTQDKKWYFQRIFLCRQLKYNSAELKELFKDEIF